MSSKIVYLEDHEDLRVLMTDLLKTFLNEDCNCYSSFVEIQKDASEVLKSSLVIVDINLGQNQQSGLDAYNWLSESEYKGKVVFITGHANSHPLVNKALSCGVDVWIKPVRAGQMIEKIKEIFHRENEA